MEKHSMLESTEEQMFIYTVSMSRCCGPKVEKRPPNRWLPTPRWASQVAALRKLGTRAPVTAAISCRNSLERFWQVVTSKMLSSEILRFQSVFSPFPLDVSCDTWCCGQYQCFPARRREHDVHPESLETQLLATASNLLVCWNCMPNSNSSM